jgi:HIT-related
MLRSNTHKYIEHKYPENHWALDSTKEGTCIAFVKFRDKYSYAIKLNPTDRRGYRSLVTYLGDNQSDIQSTFNRQYTVAEQRGLSDITTLMVEIYKKIGLPITQTAQAGNNSHSFDETSGITQIGNTKEPSMLHTHVWGRGNPKQEYIPGVPLDGPNPGEMFDMMAKTPSVPGNQKKVPWEKNQLEKGLEIFKNALHEYVNSSEFQQEFGQSLQVDIFQLDKIIENINQPNFYLSNNAMVNLTFNKECDQNPKKDYVANDFIHEKLERPNV